MNYIYDIYLNFSKTLYDFFDWNKNDKIVHIKKIPIFKISNSNLQKIISHDVKIDLKLLNEISNKTESWNYNLEYKTCAIFTDGDDIIAVQFDSLGNSEKKSFLQIDEELEILNSIKKYKEVTISFKILSKTSVQFKTRKQLSDDQFIDSELKNIDSEKLKFIYFECFNKKETNKNLIIKNIKKISKSSKTYKKLFNILKLTSIANNKMV